MMIKDVSESNLDKTRAFLETHAETSLFLLSNLAEFGPRTGDHLNSGDYKFIEEDGEIRAVFCLTRRGILLPQTAGRRDLTESIVRACERERNSIQGVVGEWQAAEAIWRILCATSRFRPTHTSKEVLFHLALSKRDDRPRRARLLDPIDFAEWIHVNTAFLTEQKLPIHGTNEERETNFASESTARRWWGIFENHQLVSTAALNAVYKDIGQVGGVYTVPGKRRQGLARAVMLTLSSDAIDQHGLRKLVLFTGEENFAAQALYQSMGFARLGHFGLLFGVDADAS
jgi:predicted GNAT family acetyltransferase